MAAEVNVKLSTQLKVERATGKVRRSFPTFLPCVTPPTVGLYRMADCRVVCLHQGSNHVFKVGGPMPWSRVLLPFYRKH